MRSFFLFFFMLSSFFAIAQEDTSKVSMDTLAPYEKSPFIPTFSIQQPDSSWFFNTHLKEGKPVLILYFSPDCGHCQLETDNLISSISKLPDLQIVMVTSRPFEDMNRFAKHYKIYKFPAITIGRDPSYYVTKFYDVKFTPFSALYDKDGKLVKVYRKGLDMEELIKLSN